MRTCAQVNKTKLALLLGEGMSLHEELEGRCLHSWPGCKLGQMSKFSFTEKEMKGRVGEPQIFVILCVSKPLWEIVSLLQIQGFCVPCQSLLSLLPSCCLFSKIVIQLHKYISRGKFSPVQSHWSFSTSVLLVSCCWWRWWAGHSPLCPKPGVGCVPRGAPGCGMGTWPCHASPDTSLVTANPTRDELSQCLIYANF